MAEQKKPAASLDKLRKQADSVKETAVKRQASQGNAAGGEVYIPLNKIRFDRGQPRRCFNSLDGRVREKDQAYIEELAANIAQQAEGVGGDGLTHAVTVAELEDGTYVVRAGECRTRAHIFLKREVIRARINNNLGKRNERLLFQLSENIHNKELEDWEMAQTIKELMEGNDDEGEPPMNQSEIAGKLGKSEGYLVRFVVFGDDELRKRWVEPGIVDGAEKLYRLKLLPEHMKLDILRRVVLTPDHPDYLPTPLKRSVIDDYSANFQMEKRRKKLQEENAGSAGKAAAKKDSLPAKAPGAGVPPTAESPNPTSVAPAASAPQSPIGTTSAHSEASAAEQGGGSYSLSEAARNELLSGAASSNAAAEHAEGGSMRAPVNCKVPLNSLEQLLPLLRTRPEVLDSMRRVICNVQLPADLAQQVASALVGRVVEEEELPSTIQNELSTLASGR